MLILFVASSMSDLRSNVEALYSVFVGLGFAGIYNLFVF